MIIKKFKVYGYICLVALAVMFFSQSISMAIYEKNKSDEMENLRAQIDNDEAILSREERATLDLINEYRAQNGLEGLKPYSALQDVAKLKAEDFIENDYLAHDSDKLGTPFEMLENNNIVYSIAGENLAGNISPEKAVEAWINSKDHRANILEEKYQYTGIYIIDSDIYGKIFVQLFIGI